MDNKAENKQRIMESALHLFSEKGFDQVSIEDISEMSDVPLSTMTHYYKTKEAIFNNLVDLLQTTYFEKVGSASRMTEIPATLSDFVEMSMRRIRFTTSNQQIRKMRKLLIREQFRNEQIKRLATNHTYSSIIELNKYFIEKYIERGMLKNYDADLLTFEFTLPVAHIIQLIDREPEREAELMEIVRKHMRHFVEIYGVAQQ